MIIIHTPLQTNQFTLVYINPKVNSLYQVNGITGWFFCRAISSIYLKRFWGNFRIIPWIYKCESYSEPFKLINRLWILNKLFIKFSRNMLNLEKLSSCARTEFLIEIFLKHGITQGDTRNGHFLIGVVPAPDEKTYLVATKITR